MIVVVRASVKAGIGRKFMMLRTYTIWHTLRATIFPYCHEGARLVFMKTRLFRPALFLLLSGVAMPPQAYGATEEPAASDGSGEPSNEIVGHTIVQSELEVALVPVVEQVAKRLVLRNEQNLHDVWLVTRTDFEKVSEAIRQAISSKRALSGGLRIERWTWLEPDRSYVVDVAGGRKPWRFRLTRHMGGALLELYDAGAASDAARWAPPYRPKPILLPHGVGR